MQRSRTRCHLACHSSRTGSRGAALVEFVIAIPVILLLFFSIMQWSIIAYNHLLVQHAAFVSARAEAVVHPGMSDSGAENDVTTAARTFFPTRSGAVSVTSASAAPESQEMNTTTVTFEFPCGVPLGNIVVCGVGRTHTLTAAASFPNQGAYYQKIWSGS